MATPSDRIRENHLAHFAAHTRQGKPHDVILATGQGPCHARGMADPSSQEQSSPPAPQEQSSSLAPGAPGSLSDPDEARELAFATPAPQPKAPLQWRVVRELTDADVPALLTGKITGSDELTCTGAPQLPVPAAPTLSSLRHSHHQAARLIALGRDIQEVALCTGYSAGYLSSLKGDPAFAELIKYYTAKTDEVFVDVARRMREMGLSALEELQERMTSKPQDWPRKDLMEFIELVFGKGGAAKAAGLEAPSGKGGSAASVPIINVQFVSAPDRSVGEIIDVSPNPLPKGLEKI